VLGPASLLEAANGIGMTKWQRLLQVELPTPGRSCSPGSASPPPLTSVPHRWRS
jgi:hypothetical protein